jgi:hypothetical protein
VPFSYAELQAFERFAALMRPNPRHLKRMVNVYRLVRTLARSNADEALLQNPAAMIRWLVMWGQWPYASLRMLELFDELLDETAEGEVPEGLGGGDPLVYLLGKVEPRLDATTRNRLDDQAEDLRVLLKEDGAAFSWTELRSIRKYTVNFNPAVEERPARRRTRDTLAAVAAGGQRLDPNRAVGLDRPVRVVGDLPRMAVGVDEHARVAAPECLGAMPWDRGPCRFRLGDHRVDLGR